MQSHFRLLGGLEHANQAGLAHDDCSSVPVMRLSSVLLAIQILACPASALALDWKCSDVGFGEEGCGFATCGDPLRTTADALFVLRAAVNDSDCSRCRCDADGSGSVRATDALLILRFVVGQHANLFCTACNDLQVVESTTTVTYDEVIDDVAGTEDGGLLVVSRDGGSIVARKLDAALVENGPAQRVETGQSSLLGSLACAGSAGNVAVAWDWRPETDFPVPHDYDDIGNVRFAVLPAGASSAEPIDAHVPVKGSQTLLGILCRAGGGFTTIWKSSDYAYTEVSEGALSFYDVVGGPLNGVYLRSYDEHGEPLEEPALVVGTLNQPFWTWSRPAPSPAGRMVIGSRDLVFVVSKSGSVTASADLVANTYFGSSAIVTCSNEVARCVAMLSSSGIRAHVFDPVAPSSSLFLFLRGIEVENGEPHSRITEPTPGTVACDQLGICVATWTLTRRLDVSPEEPNEVEFLGSFGRAFDLRSGDVGMEFPLPSWRVHNIGPGRFASVERSAYGEPAHSVLHTFEVR
jgi:hypothetical protein